ncbi:HAD family phosphatase [Gilvimarinus sp. DA14]|uniref:HAD family hydrolase n=1 Tax=Gilvimarinus sp. DA14 TaxID=2956798 RepID=UPI0020B7B824|nr:HAD-IB family hydrolase [Gilvimarinus sp. DA14]UTF58727.1 HAD-IB family hydrolase [Gilvimarinus sp. DA14]
MRPRKRDHHSPQAVAFFDVDDTLISNKSMLSFQNLWFQQHPDPIKERDFQRILAKLKEENCCWKSLNEAYYQSFSGRSVAQVEDLARQWFNFFHSRQSFYRARVLQRLQHHQTLGHLCVFVSGSFPALLDPIARDLNIKHILATDLEVVGQKYTGRINPPVMIGEGKERQVKEFLSQRSVNPENCYAYGDDISDFPMLALVGHPVVIAGGRELEAQAKKLGWSIIQPD